MFRVSKTDNAENSIYIQGARARSNLADIAGITFQNFDADTSVTYNMAKITMQDHYGDAIHNGAGDIVFKTNPNGNGLVEQMRVSCDGHVTVSGTVACEALLENGTALSDKYLKTSDASALIYANDNFATLSNLACGSVPLSGNVTLTGPLTIQPASNVSCSLAVTGTVITDELFTTSDARFKTVTQSNLDATETLDKIMQLQPCRFFFTGDASKRERTGLLAQDVLQHAPDAVWQQQDILRLDPVVLQAYLVACVQTLERRIGELERALKAGSTETAETLDIYE
jgi:hypothetical protein